MIVIFFTVNEEKSRWIHKSRVRPRMIAKRKGRRALMTISEVMRVALTFRRPLKCIAVGSLKL